MNNIEKESYLVAVFRQGYFCGYLGWKTVCGFRQLEIFPSSAKMEKLANWSSYQKAEKAITAKREYANNYPYVAKDWLERNGYQLKIVSASERVSHLISEPKIQEIEKQLEYYFDKGKQDAIGYYPGDPDSYYEPYRTAYAEGRKEGERICIEEGIDFYTAFVIRNKKI